MGRPPVQSDLQYDTPEVDRDQEQVTHGASPRAAKVVYIVIGVLLAALAVLVGIGLHIPRGE